MDYSIEIQNLCKKYTDFSLKNVSFNVPKGSIVGFIGENGAGKTTTIKSIVNLIRFDSGTIKVLGKDGLKEGMSIKSKIGVVFDSNFFFEELTPKNINLIMKNIMKDWDEPLFLKYCNNWNLPINKSMKSFSKGMKMKTSIASALAHHPDLLILDEATSGLDPISRNEILDIFQDFIQDEEHSILFSSHITSDLEKIADYVVFIHQGKILFEKEKDELIENYGVIKAEDLNKYPLANILSTQTSRFGVEALVDNRSFIKEQYPDLVMDHASIDDIMLFYVKGEVR